MTVCVQKIFLRFISTVKLSLRQRPLIPCCILPKLAPAQVEKIATFTLYYATVIVNSFAYPFTQGSMYAAADGSRNIFRARAVVHLHITDEDVDSIAHAMADVIACA